MKYKKSGLVCQGNIGHKMWGVASITMPMVHRDIDPYEKVIYILDDTIRELDAIVKKEMAKR